MKKILLFIVHLSMLNSGTFDPDRLDIFYDNFFTEQSEFVYKNLRKEPDPIFSSVIPPKGMVGFAPLVIQNGSGIPPDRLYVIGKGQMVDGKDAYFLKPDLETGICKLVIGSDHNSVDSDISVKLSSLPNAGENSYYLYVPQMISGRFYISVDHPLYMKTSSPDDTVISINDPSVTATQDPNYYTLYQNFEFTLDKYYELYANVSNVDFFSLPLQLSSHTYPSGDLYPTLDDLTVVGYPIDSSRQELLNQIKEDLAKYGNPQEDNHQNFWSRLAISFYENPYEESSKTITELRIVAAKTSIGLNRGDKFSGAKSRPSFFPSKYLNENWSHLLRGSYFEAVHEYYKTNRLDLTIFPANHPETIYTLSSNSTDLNLNFNLKPGQKNNPAPPHITVHLDKLSTEGLLGGDVGVWMSENAITPHAHAAPDPWQTEIAKALSSLFTAGFLPYPFGNQLTLNDQFLSQFRNKLFSNPKDFEGGPWYNVYDKVIHDYLVKTEGVGLGYAFDYDDLLGIAGLLHLRIQSNGLLNPDQPYPVLSIGKIDTEIPDPFSDFGPYTLNINPIAKDSPNIEVEYIEKIDNKISDGKKVIRADSKKVIRINNLINAFTVRYFGQEGPDESDYSEYIVYPKYQLVLPKNKRYNNFDANLMNGIVFSDVSVGESIEDSLTVSFPGPPKK